MSQISETGQKDIQTETSSSCIKLIKDNPVADIIEAVIQSISPGWTISDMLGIKRDLILYQVKAI